MEEFTLEKYLANPERKIVTRTGKPVRIICTDRKNPDGYTIIALVDEGQTERIYAYTKSGSLGWVEDYALFFAPVKHEGWVNIHESGGRTWIDDVFSTEVEAWNAGCVYRSYVATIKIEWTE